MPVPGGVATLTETPPDLHGATVVDEKTTPPETPDRTIVDKAPSTMNVPTGWSVPAPQPTSIVSASLATLQPGAVFGNRYEILRELGQGGMGAVYQARDRELDRMVAMKVIRPELATRPDILQRFKQEIILARQVTHRNVIRIFDLGEADGIKFITMEFIEGQDLKTLVAEKGKLKIEETVAIMQQVCLALEAAHTEGVVHRDLKPQNIMLDKQGKVAVMDFGIARSIEFGGMTQTGALIGTPEYMSPEQVQGDKVDARSDLFTLGIIFYELLTVTMPYKAETVMGTMIKRTKERARPPVELNPEVPQFLSDVVSKCLEADPQKRYQSAREIFNDLEAWQAGAARRALNPVVRWLRYAPRYQKWVVGSVIVLLLASGGYAVRQKLPLRLSLKSGAHVEPISLAILPFRNASGDPSLDWLGPNLAEMLRTDIGQSSSLRTVSSDRLYQILHDLRISGNTELDPTTLQRVADFTSADQLLWGQYVKLGDQIRIDATLQDLKRQRASSLKAEAPNEKELLRAIDELAQTVQKSVASSPDVLKELRAKTLKPSSQSLQALRYYNEGVQLVRQGKNQEALKQFETATKEDPAFALAYSRLGQSYASLGYDDKAAQFSQKAVDLSGQLSPQERYLILANQALILKDNKKALESYENLAKVAPDDSDIQLILATLYQNTGSLEAAREHLAKILERDPKDLGTLLAMGRVETQRGNPQGALGYLSSALTLAIQLGNEQQRAATLASLGEAYRRLGKLDDAVSNLQEALAIRRTLGDKRGIAITLNGMATAQDGLGKPDAALKNFQEALRLGREIGDREGTGRSLSNLSAFYIVRGKYDEALKLIKESLQIQRELGDTWREGYCLNQIGGVYFNKGQYEDAVTYFQQALQLREKLKTATEIAETTHNLGEASSRMGQYDEAINYYLHAMELYRSAGERLRTGIQSHSIGTVFEYQGRYGAALKAKQEALKTVNDLGDRGFWLAAILSSYGNELSLLGRFDEAQKALDEALTIARKTRSDAMIAQTLNFQGDRLFYRGEYKSAQSLYEQALQAALKMADPYFIFVCKFNLAKAAVQQGRAQAALGSFKTLAQEAQARRLNYFVAECLLSQGEAFLALKNYTQARQQLELALRKSQVLGARALLAKSDYLLGTAMRLSGNQAEAARHYTEARRALDEIGKEAGNDELLKRSDLSPIVAESPR